MHTGVGFVKVGWDKFHNDRFATDFGVKIGYSENYFTTDLNKAQEVNPIRVDALFTEFDMSNDYVKLAFSADYVIIKYCPTFPIGYSSLFLLFLDQRHWLF